MALRCRIKHRLRMSLPFLRKPVPRETSIEIDGVRVPVTVRMNARARSYRLTLTAKGEPVLTLPPNGRWREAEGFLDRNRAWLAVRLARRSAPPVLADGETVLLRGVPHRIRATGRLRGRVEIATADDGHFLLVPGDTPHLARRLTDWLKAEARQDLERQTAIHAATLGVCVRIISLRSQRTRWGSCSSAGNLSYNWRLIAAPPYVLDYVAAHEVAHLVEMNHSPAFWANVKKTLPDMERGRAWLKAHGRELMALGA